MGNAEIVSAFRNNHLSQRNMKKILFLLLVTVFTSITLVANSANIQTADINGTFTTSAYPGTYQLYDYNYFPKTTHFVGITMKTLPDGYCYRWAINEGKEGGTIFVMPDTGTAYVQYNGDVDNIELTICVVNKETDSPVAIRKISFVYMANFDKPAAPRID